MPDNKINRTINIYNHTIGLKKEYRLRKNSFFQEMCPEIILCGLTTAVNLVSKPLLIDNIFRVLNTCRTGL